VSWFERRTLGEAVWMSFRLPATLARFVAEKGSIAVDGVSLTVNSVNDDGFEVTIIPITLKKTKFGRSRAGRTASTWRSTFVARYVSRLMSPEG